MTRSGRSVAVGLLVLAVVIAGCGAPLAQSAGTTPTAGTGTGQSDGTAANGSDGRGGSGGSASITVTNGSLSLDPGTVFGRLQTLQGTNVSVPNVLQVYNSLGGFQNQSGSVGASGAGRFYAIAGMRTDEVNLTESVTRQKNGYVTGLGSVVLYVGENASRVEELLLVVHELTHYVQLQSGRQEKLVTALGGATLTDEQYVLRSVVEGGAVVTTDAYLARYTNSSYRNSDMYTTVQSQLPDGHVARYGNGKYINGWRYMGSRADDPAELATVYDDPPTTSEQILHELPPGSEPPTPLSVIVETGGRWVAAGHDRMGEAFVQTALESGVGQRRAAAAAAGWGNDTLRFLRPRDGDGETAYAWVLRWDDAANRSEFQSAYRESLRERGERTDGIWSLPEQHVSAALTSPTDRTAVLLFGPQSLVENATVSGTTGRVTVATETRRSAGA